MFIHNLPKGEYYQFPELISVKDDITTADTRRYIHHLNILKKYVESRFDDVLTTKICDWLINHLTAKVNKADVTFQEELFEIIHDEESKTNFYICRHMQLWQSQKMLNPYPNMLKIIFKLLITFPTSYLVEAGFSAANKIFTKKKNAKKK